jgi:predicted DNA-binding protein
MDYSEGKDKHVYSLRVTEKMRQEIQRIADRENVTPAFVVRKAVEMLIEQDKKDEKR